MSKSMHWMLLLCFACSISFGYAFLLSRQTIFSGHKSIVQRQHAHSVLQMTAVDQPATAPVKRKITNPLDSPSVIRYTKDSDGPNGRMMNAFNSPSVQLNGVDSARTINPEHSPSVIMLRRRKNSDNNSMAEDEMNPLKSPGVIFQGIDSAKMKNAMKSPSLQVTATSKTAQDMPLNLIIGQESIKTALILLAIQPKIGGIVITGGRGTAKSVMARALHRVMPPIEVIKDSPYNIDPMATNSKEIDDFLLQSLALTEEKRLNTDYNQDKDEDMAEKLEKLKSMERTVIPCPFVQVPVNVMEDRLFGSVDVKATMEKGYTVFTPGLLAAAHRGILYIDDINLLDTELVNLMLQAVTDGQVQVEREGISIRYPCQPLLIATASTDAQEGGMGGGNSGLSDAMLDRIGIALSADSEVLTMDERVQAVNTVLGFASLMQKNSLATSTSSSNTADDDMNTKTTESTTTTTSSSYTDATAGLSQETLQNAYTSEQGLQTAIVFAREYLKDVKLTTSQIRYLCEEAVKGGVQGHRGDVVAARVALAAAALDSSSTVRSEDLRLAVKLALIPRSIYRNIPPEMMEEMMTPPPPPPPPPAPSNEAQENAPDQDTEEDNDKDEDKDNDDKDKEDEEEEEEEEEVLDEPTIPEEFMFDAIAVEMEGEMMKFSGKQRSGKGGKSGQLLSRDRGRYLRPVLPREGQPIRIAIDATLREAAKHQQYRREAAVSAYQTKQNTLDGTTNMDHHSSSSSSESENNKQRKAALELAKVTSKIYLDPSDLRAKLMARKAGSLLIFVVDASGSMALNRMNAAKGAAVALLQEAYQSRDKIALIPFQGNYAEVLLPPTRSISLAKNRLDSMPCGGGSPLAHALSQAMKLGLNAMASGDTGRCVIVLISDGRANVPLEVSLRGEEEGVKDAEVPVPKTDAEKKEQRQQLKDEIIGLSRQLGEMSAFKLLVIDTENKFVSTGFAKEIAQAANGRYHFIPKASADAMKQVTVDAVASLKKEQTSRR